MSNRKKIQHRAQRDTSNKENFELKSQIKKLKIQLSKLKRELQKENLLKPEEIHEFIEEEVDTHLKSNKSIHCELCGSQYTGSYSTPQGKTLLGCKTCRKWRKVI